MQVPYPASAFMLDDKPGWYKDRLPTWHGIYGPLFDVPQGRFRIARPQASAAFEEMVRSYWRTILSVDDSVGRLYALLEEKGQLDNTVFIFTSDHGILNGEHGMVDKRTAHEPSIRIPLVVRYPGLTRPSQPRVVEPHGAHHGLRAVDSRHRRRARVARPRTAGPGRRLAQGQNDAGLAAELRLHVQLRAAVSVHAERARAANRTTGSTSGIRMPPRRTSPNSTIWSTDPDELVNLIDDPRHRARVAHMHGELDRQLKALGAWPDVMPLDEGIGQELPDAAIR